MSITGSLVGYENNNDVANNKKAQQNSRSILNSSIGSMGKTCPSLNSSISNSVITTASSNAGHHNTKYQNSKRKQQQKYLQQQQHQQQQQQQQQHQHQQQLQQHHNQMHHHSSYMKDQKSYLHLNSLWSIWYGVVITLFQGYLAVHGAYRFLGCSLIQWKIEPVVELNLQIVLCGVVFILLPLFFTTAVFKVGNLANDGIKLANSSQRQCSMAPHDGLEEEAKGGTLRALWTHGGPTAPFIHIVIAMCLLLPRLLLEARIIENGLLPRETIWRTELDFIAVDRRNLVVLSFITSPYQNVSSEDYNDTMYPVNSHSHHTEMKFFDDNENISDSNEDEYRINYPKSANRENHEILNSEEEEEDDSDLRALGESISAEGTSSPISIIGTISTKHSTTIATTTTTATTSTTTKTTTTPFTTVITTIKNPVSTPRIPKSMRSETRKNGGRRNGNRSHRKHHSSKSDESKSSKSDEFDHELEMKPPKMIDFNRLDDFEMSTIFESNSNTKIRVTTPSKPNTSSGSSEEQGFNRRQSTQATKRDSNIHIVKTEKLPEIIPATPIATNSKIIEIKKTKKVKRMADDEMIVDIEPEYLISAPMNESTAISDQTSGLVRLDGFSGMLQTFFGIEKEIDVDVFTHPPSTEFVNLMFALFVWSVRYPAVFWATTKPFAIVFSIQMIASALDIICGYIGISNLYKLQIFSEAMPVHNPGLILNATVTLSLFLLSTILVIASSMIMYLYGHGRLAARMRDRSMISMKTNDSWIYFAHCASLCFVLALSVVKAPLLNDLSATYKNNLHCPTFISALVSVVYLFLWIVIWLGLTAKRRWTFKLPPVEQYGIIKGTATQPLLISTRGSNAGLSGSDHKSGGISTTSSTDGVEDIYWPKLTPSSPKLKVTFNEVTSTSDDILLIENEQDGKRLLNYEQHVDYATWNDRDIEFSSHADFNHTTRGAALCIAGITGEIDDGDYATLRGGVGTPNNMGNNNIGGSGGKVLHLSEYDELPPPPPSLQLLPPPPSPGDILDDNTSEEGKLLACVRDDSVTYASTRDLEPPHPPPPPPLETNETIIHSPHGIAPQAQPENMHLTSSSPEHHLISPLAPVTVTVHSNEAHITSSTPRCLRRADSGVPNEALTPRSDTTSTTESTTSPPERAPSESSSGVHSGEEREEVVIRPRAVCKAPPKPPQPAIQEEPYGRSTNMRMSSFNNDPNNKSNSATLPLTRSLPEPKVDYSHCSTMPLPIGCHSQAASHYKSQIYSPQASNKQHIMHTTLPNGLRYSNPHFLRRIPHITKAESPYGHLGLGSGHHTFSKLLQDPLHSLAATSIPEDRDSANYSMSSDQDCLYATANHMN